MAKSKKPTLKDLFEEEFGLDGHMIQEVHGATLDNIWNFFVPHLRKTLPKPKLEIPADKLKEYNELWPEGKLPTGQYGKCSISELESSFRAFFTAHSTFTDWGTIFACTSIYLAERRNEDWAFTRRSKYFVRRENSKDKSVEFLLADYYQRFLDGFQTQEEQFSGFEPKII